MNKAKTDPERLVDEMAVALCELPRLDDEAACILQLMQNGWRAAVIMKYLDEALELARMARADGWHKDADSHV